MHLSPIPTEHALAFCGRLSTFCWILQTGQNPLESPGTVFLDTAALRALLSPKREILNHTLFAGNDRLTAFADRLNQGLPEDMARSQKGVYEKNFKPSAGLSEEYQSSQYFCLLAAQMIDGLRQCSGEGWGPVVDGLPFEDQLKLANALEMFGDAGIGCEVRERCRSRAVELFWNLVLA